MKSIPNELAARFAEVEVRKQLMKEYGDSDSAFLGHNEGGELVEMSVCPDEIIVRTFQDNGWVRVNYYDENGLPNGETFDGKWENESERMQQAEPEEITKVYTVAIINKQRPEWPAWISAYTTEKQANDVSRKALEWIQDHGCAHLLKVETVGMPVNCDECLNWLEATCG